MSKRIIIPVVLFFLLCLVLSGLPGKADQTQDNTATPETAIVQEKTDEQSAKTEEKKPSETKSAQQQAEETPEIEVEVVGKKLGEQPVPSLAPTTGEVITSINAAELEATGETNLADALEFLPGVTITHQGRRFETFVNVRASSTPVVLLDGALISSGIFANRILYTLPFSAIERVDVIRSSSGLIYGPQALMGGVINIVTKSGKNRGNGEAKMYAQGGSFDYLNYGLATGAGKKNDGLYVVFDHDNADSNLKFGGHNMNRAFVKADFTLNNGDPVKFSMMTVDGWRNFDVWDKAWQIFAKTGPAYWGLNPYQERLETLDYSHPFNKQNSSGLDLELYHRGQNYHNFSFGGPIQPKPGQIPFYDEVGDIYGENLMLRVQAGRTHYLRLGLENWKLNGYTQNFVLQKDGTLLPQPKVPYWTSAAGSLPAASKLLSYFAQDEWSITPRTRFFYGGRYEIPGGDLHNAFTYALGLEHDLGRQMDLYAHYGTGVVYPTPAALAANPALEDETSGNIDLGIAKHFKNLVGRVGFFQSDIKNYFVSYLKTGGNPSNSKDYLQTQADFTRSGLEAEVEGALPRIRGMNYFFNYTYLHQEVTRIPVDGEGRPLQLAVPPKGQFSTGLRWSSPNSRAHLALSYTNVTDQIARSGYYSLAFPLDGYQYANLTGSIDLGRGWALNAAINNMFDENYESQPGFPRPGRNYVIGISSTASWR